MADIRCVGSAFIGVSIRPIYSLREIKRGKSKGRFEITYRKGSRFKKTKISKQSIHRIYGKTS